MAKIQLLTFILFLLLSVAISGIVVPSYLRTEPYVSQFRAALGPGQCPQTCWHGITIGKTSIAEAARILAADSSIVLLGDDDNGCQVRWAMVVDSVTWQGRICTGINGSLTKPVDWIELEFSDKKKSSRLTVFEAYLMLQKPVGSECTTFSPHKGTATYSAGIVFQNNVAIGWQREMPYTRLLFDPLETVDWIQYSQKNYLPFFMPGSWHGFTPDRLGNSKNYNCLFVIE